MRDSTIRPVLAVSAAVFRDGRVLIAHRTRPPQLWSLPGGAVEAGETLIEAAARELREETGVEAEFLGYAGHREVILRDQAGAVTGHYVVLAFAARWRAGEAKPGPEALEVRWIESDALGNFETTEGLAEIVAAARRLARA
jgi:8-oxo-dGTP diphosphatase